ncbi:MAG: leucine-rich repeat domain-containing protein, partial [Lachnospiraceae bacterium]|nr:leucine-rich repeat domain-containing protein [Lachnospiraceae bacterium]
MAKKEAKKKNLRLRRRIRRTLGSICLITALLVAAIPVPEVKAATATKKYTWEQDILGNSASKIPTLPSNYQYIYTYYEGNATFAWAFVNNGGTWVAVILGYRITGQLENATLTIPDTVNAYTLYNENIGDTNQSHVAVGRNFEPLYYISRWDPVLDVSGNDTGERVPGAYSPCTYGDRNNWENLKEDEFYYKDSNGKYLATTTSQEQWIKEIPVVYIGNQSVITNPNIGTGAGVQQEWVIAQDSSSSNVMTSNVNGVTHYLNDNPDSGVFANRTNIQTLKIGGNLIGIGNYAFYNCTELR